MEEAENVLIIHIRAGTRVTQRRHGQLCLASKTSFLGGTFSQKVASHGRLSILSSYPGERPLRTVFHSPSPSPTLELLQVGPQRVGRMGAGAAASP